MPKLSSPTGRAPQSPAVWLMVIVLAPEPTLVCSHTTQVFTPPVKTTPVREGKAVAAVVWVHDAGVSVQGPVKTLMLWLPESNSQKISTVQPLVGVKQTAQSIPSSLQLGPGRVKSLLETPIKSDQSNMSVPERSAPGAREMYSRQPI